MPDHAPGPARREARPAPRTRRPDVPETVLATVLALPAVRPGVVARTLLRIAQRHLPPPAGELSASVIAAWWPAAPRGGRAAPGSPGLSGAPE